MKIEGLNLNSTKHVLAKIQRFISKNSFILIITFILILFSLIVWRINYYSRLEPTTEMVDNQIKATVRPKIDQSLVKRLEKLESENIQVQTLFNEARENPFSE
jgi:predicted negative regulator of RcsB-dependent stress response